MHERVDKESTGHSFVSRILLAIPMYSFDEMRYHIDE